MSGTGPAYVSCDLPAIYDANGSFPEPHLRGGPRLASDPRAYGITTVAPVFAAASYGVPFSPAIFAQDDDFTRVMHDLYRSLAIKTANPSLLVAVEDAETWGSVIRCGSAADPRIVYETYRPNDRPAVSLTPEEAVAAPAPVDECFFLGSAGSFNYGHFLVDDLPRLRALGSLDPSLPVAMVSYGPAIDRIRTEAVRAFAGEREIVLLDAQRPWRFRRLLYATPVSVHPTHKHPGAVHWAVETALTAAGTSHERPHDRLFVSRKAGDSGRTLVNQAAVAEVCRRLGYRIVHAEDHGFLDQVRLFAGTRTIAGQMGAAMTNAMFCPDRTRVIHLAPRGWTEPFYWDLAMARGQDYRAAYGETQGDEDVPAHQRDFRMDLALLAEMLE